MSTTPIQAIDRTACKTLAEATAEALASVAAAYGLTVSVDGGRYEPRSGTFAPRVEYSLPDSERRAFVRDASTTFYGWSLTEEDYGAEITVAGRRFTLSGINRRAPKFPFVGTGADGKTYKLTEASVRAALGR